MKLYLEPYNHYVLYAALILLLLFLIILGVKAGKLLKTVQTIKPSADSIQKNVTLAKIKMEAMQDKKKKIRKRINVTAS